MKTIFLVGILFLIALSCEKTYLVSPDQVPEWLKERIAEDEKIIEATPKLKQNIGAWIRYEFKGEYYFEYHNMLSSSFPDTYTEEGIKPDFTVPLFRQYLDEKCCDLYIWKAPNYHGG